MIAVPGAGGPSAAAHRLVAAIEPMLLSVAPMPFNKVGWVHEIKYDGYRVLAAAAEHGAYLKTRKGADATAWFPEVASAVARLPGGPHVLDGEVAVLDAYGRSDFNRLHQRALMRRWKPGADLVVYCAFDLLVQDGVDLRASPLADRKAALKRLLGHRPPSLLFVDHDEDGVWLYEQALCLELEGTIAKRLASVYRSGVRSDDWRKIRRPGAVPRGRFRR